MKFNEILNEGVEIINEGALTDLLTSTFKGFKRTIGSAAEASLQKALNDVAQGGKKVALSALRKNSSYQDALKATVAEASRVRYGKSFDQLLQFDKNAAQKLVNDVQTGMEKELAEKAAMSKTIIDKDVKSATSTVGKTQKAVNTGKATQQDLASATKELVSNTKLQTKYGEMQKVIAGMDKLSAKKVADIIKKDAKVIDGTGPSVSGGVKGNTQIFSGGKIFTITKEQLSKFPGKVKRVIVNNPVKSTLIGAGLTAAALYYFFGGDADGVILTDENGNDVPDFGGQWAPCIQELLKSKEGVITKSSTGQVGVMVKPAEYPNGVIFYSNGRVLDVSTKKMGSWSCKAGKPSVQAEDRKMTLMGLVNEQGDAQIAKDVDTMIDLLDFPVSYGNLVSANKLLKNYATNGKGKQFLNLYQQSGLGGGSLGKSLQYITTTEPESVQAKSSLTNTYNQILSGKGGGVPTPTPGGKLGLSNININWDGQKKGENTPTPSPIKKKNKVNYHDCSSKDVFEFGCISPKIAEIQGCLDIKPQKGYFGPKTKTTLEGLGYNLSKGITLDIYNDVKSKCGDTKGKRYSDAELQPVSTQKIKLSDTGKIGDLSGKIKPINMGTSSNNGEAIYKMLQSNYGDGSNPEFPYIFSEGRRLKYKGESMSGNSKDQLSQFIATLGYREEPIKDKDKNYGVKYVWVKE